MAQPIRHQHRLLTALLQRAALIQPEVPGVRGGLLAHASVARFIQAVAAVVVLAAVVVGTMAAAAERQGLMVPVRMAVMPLSQIRAAVVADRAEEQPAPAEVRLTAAMAAIIPRAPAVRQADRGLARTVQTAAAARAVEVLMVVTAVTERNGALPVRAVAAAAVAAFPGLLASQVFMELVLAVVAHVMFRTLLQALSSSNTLHFETRHYEIARIKTVAGVTLSTYSFVSSPSFRSICP
jgi:hypothetical protein